MPPTPSQPTAGAAAGAGAAANKTIAIAIRIRPLSSKEEGRGAVKAWDINDNGTRFEPCDELPELLGKSETQFDSLREKLPKFPEGSCFAETTSTQEIYDAVGKGIVTGCMEGKNGTVLAYGQTSSGKTHTMLGNASEHGVITLSIIDVFRHISECKDRGFMVRVSMCEIYNEVIRDLLDPTKSNFKVYEDREKGVVIKGITEDCVTSSDHVWQLLQTGFANRSVGRTDMNEGSSRSHTVFRIVIESKPLKKAPDAAAAAAEDGSSGEQAASSSRSRARASSRRAATRGKGRKRRGGKRVRHSTLNLVDLAGCERMEQAGTHGKRKRLKEGININRSLLTLGKVIQRLVNQRPGVASHVPFRDSQLTRILAKSIGGNAQTAVVCTLAPSHEHFFDSQRTLQFASNACRVRTHARVNEITMEKAMIGAHEEEMQKLRQQLMDFGPPGGAGAPGRDGVGPGGATAEELSAAVEKAASDARAEAEAANQEMRDELSEKLEHLKSLILRATDPRGEVSTCADAVDAARGAPKAPEPEYRRNSSGLGLAFRPGSKPRRGRVTWGPRYWSRKLAFAASKNPAEAAADGSAVAAVDGVLREAEKLRNDRTTDRLVAAEQEIAELNDRLAWYEQSHLDYEERCGQLERFVMLLTQGQGLDDKTPDELEELQDIHTRAIGRIVEAKFGAQARAREQELEQRVRELENQLEDQARVAEESKQLRTQHLEARQKALLEELEEEREARSKLEQNAVQQREAHANEMATIRQVQFSTELKLRAQQVQQHLQEQGVARVDGDSTTSAGNAEVAPDARPDVAEVENRPAPTPPAAPAAVVPEPASVLAPVTVPAQQRQKQKRQRKPQRGAAGGKSTKSVRIATDKENQRGPAAPVGGSSQTRKKRAMGAPFMSPMRRAFMER